MLHIGLLLTLLGSTPIGSGDETHATPRLESQDEIRTIPLGRGIYMLVGRGGNLGLSIGASGTFLIDDQFAPMAPKIKAAIAELTELPVKFLINTHLHGDHTGGNESFGKQGALIVAHENVRKRMSAEQLEKDLSERAGAALPVVTFAESVTFHWNDDEIRVFHVENAHTDGDSIIHFVKANVIHMGDAFFNGSYPYIDTDNGGSLVGLLTAVDRVLVLANDKTQIIPGHGELASKTDLQTYRDLLEEVRLRVLDMLEADMSIDEIVEANPTEEWDTSWGRGFMRPDVFIRIVAESLSED